MSYSSGGLIQATDYNGFVGSSPSSTANQINTVWAVGNGNAGYGQSALSTVSAGGVVTATQWATAVNTLNSIYTHQSGAGTGIGAPTAGSLISYLSTFSSSVNTAYTNRLNAATNGTDITGTAPTAATWNTSTPTTLQITRTATFASADQARYFFNAGGKLVLTFSCVNTLGNAKGADWLALLNTKFASVVVGAATNNTRTGTGGTVSASNTALGYWGCTTSNQNITTLTSASGTADYSSNSVAVGIKTNGVQGSNADKGTIFTFTIDLTDAAADTNTAPPAIPAYSPAGTPPSQGNFNDQLNLAITTNITVRPPETTNLTNSWGTVTIA
jgi:hypothetical protein